MTKSLSLSVYAVCGMTVRQRLIQDAKQTPVTSNHYLSLFCVFPLQRMNRIPVTHCTAVPDSVPRPLVDNTSANTLHHRTSAHQSVALPEDQQGANPESSPDGCTTASQRGGRTQRNHTFCLGPKCLAG